MKSKNVKRNILDIEVPFRPFKDKAADERYVAFVDILGFGRKVRDDFGSMLEIYEKVLEATQIIDALRSSGVSIRIYSDAFVLTSANLSTLTQIVTGLHMLTLAHDCLVRGGIGFGKHIEASHGDNWFILSQALVQAVEVEKRVKRPCVALHEDIEPPMDWWDRGQNSFSRRLLFFDGITLVNPFSILWGRTAANRVSRLSERYPEHREKYEWFLSLYDKVVSGEALIP